MARKKISEKDLVVSSGAAAAAARRKPVPTRAKHSYAGTETSVETPAALQNTPVTTPYEPSTDEIATLAYSYWEARGCQGGCPEEDWVRAEQELRARVSSPVL
jgi:hypothetical protein